MKKIIIFTALLIIVISLCACGKSKEPVSDASDTVIDTQTETVSETEEETATTAEYLEYGVWPEKIYSQYEINEMTYSDGKIVYTDFSDQLFRYSVYYGGVKKSELKSWISGLRESGFRISDEDKEKLSGSSGDICLYFPEEKSPYALMISFDFENGMTVAVSGPITDTGDADGNESYNIRVCLKSLKTERSFEGEISNLGLKANDLAVDENVRSVIVEDRGQETSEVRICFFDDHYVMKKEYDQCRTAIIEKLRDNGAKFYDPVDFKKEMSASELKKSDLSSYYVYKDGTMYIIITMMDANYWNYGGIYGINIIPEISE